MTFVSMSVSVLLTLLAAPPVGRELPHDGWVVTERVVPQSAEEAKLRERHVVDSPDMPKEATFECMDLGAIGSELCWWADDVHLCTEAVNGQCHIVDIGYYAFEDRSLRAVAPCISDRSAHLLLRFEPAVTNFVVTIAEPEDGYVKIVCWPDADDIGDESQGYVWTPWNPGSNQWNVGFGYWAGIEACRMDGTVDLLGAK